MALTSESYFEYSFYSLGEGKRHRVSDDRPRKPHESRITTQSAPVCIRSLCSLHRVAGYSSVSATWVKLREGIKQDR